MELLGCNNQLRFGGGSALIIPGSCKAIGEILRGLICAKFAIVSPPNSPASLSGDSSHVLKLLGGEFDVVDTIDNAFSEWIVRAEAPPFEVLSSLGTSIREAILCSRLVHRPEDKVKGSLDGTKGGSDNGYVCWGRRVAPSKQRAVNLRVSLVLCVSDMSRFNSTAFVLHDAVPNAIVDGGGA